MHFLSSPSVEYNCTTVTPKSYIYAIVKRSGRLKRKTVAFSPLTSDLRESREKSIKRLNTQLIHVLLQLESKISARRISDFHPTWGQVKYCYLKSIQLIYLSAKHYEITTSAGLLVRLWILRGKIYLLFCVLIRRKGLTFCVHGDVWRYVRLLNPYLELLST